MMLTFQKSVADQIMARSTITYSHIQEKSSLDMELQTAWLSTWDLNIFPDAVFGSRKQLCESSCMMLPVTHKEMLTI